MEKKSMSDKYVPFGSHEKAENIIKKFKIWFPQIELEWASQVVHLVKNLSANAGNTRDSCLIPGWGNGNPLQYSCLENSMDRGA